MHVTFCRDKRSRKLVSPPTIQANGLLFLKGEAAEGVLEDAIAMLEEVYYKGQNRDDLDELVRLETRRFFKRRVSHKPLVIPVFLDH